jgi:hypothetical protein
MAWPLSLRGEWLVPHMLSPESLMLLRVLVTRKRDAFPDDRRFVVAHYWEGRGTTLVVDEGMEI